MRLLVLLCAIVGFGCSANTEPSTSSDAGLGDANGVDPGAVGDTGNAGTAWCTGKSISVYTPFPLPDGRQIRRAVITSAKVDHTSSPSTLTATLEGGGTLSLRWKGDARTGLVSPYGAIAWDGSESWCINGDSEMRFTSDTDVVFERFIVGDDPGLVADDSFTQCHLPSDGGVPPPLPALVQYEACLSLPR